MSTPTLAQVQALYSATQKAASRFASYNYRNYFVRRTDEIFKPVIGAMESEQKPTSQELTHFYADHQEKLQVLQRAAQVNGMYAGPKLVVEHPRVITSGGGAGMEASAGGGGQPV